MEEERPIPSCPGYAATSNGRTVSLGRITVHGRRWKRHVLKPIATWNGRYRVDLCTPTGRKLLQVHRLVLEAFVGPCPEGMEACHANGDPSDNRIENLRWDTPSNNELDKREHGTSNQGERHPLAKLTELDVRWIRYLRKAGISLNDLAEVYHVTPTTISYIANRRTWKHLPEASYERLCV